MYDHTYIEDRIREARRMRDQAIGDMFVSAGRRINDFTTEVSHRISHAIHAIADQLRSHHLLHH